MSKAKVKVTVKPAKKGSGTLLASVPVAVVKNDNPSGKRMYETKAKALIDIRTTRNGKPRIRHR
jgi:hypothetical protein